MAHIKFTSVLLRFFPDLRPTQIGGDSIMEVIAGLDKNHPGLINYLLDDQHVLRKHVNIFIDGHIMRDRNDLSQNVTDSTEIYFIQALSGG